MTTNNRMELTAAIEALRRVISIRLLDAGHAEIVISSDSEYLVKGITQWIHGWKDNNWIGSTKKAVQNKDLWMDLDDLVNKLSDKSTIIWRRVDGHKGIVGNERCDEIATSFADKKSVKLFKGNLNRYQSNLE